MSLKRKLVAVCVVTLLIAGAATGAALATRGHASAHATSRATLLHVAAVYLGTDVPSLRRGLESGESLAQLTKNSGQPVGGLVTRLVASEKARLGVRVLPARLVQRIYFRVNRVWPAKPFLVRAAVLRHMAAYLGVSLATLRAEVKAGRNLAQIANATPGKSANALIANVVTFAKARLATALSRRQLTGAQGREIKTWLEHRITGFVHDKCPLALATFARRWGDGTPKCAGM